MENTVNFTIPQLKKWAEDNAELALTVVQATACAKTMREAVNKIQRQLLQEIELTNDLGTKHYRITKKRITEPKLIFLSEDKEALQRFDEECDKRERAAGLKPENMQFEYCPALVAESLQSDAENALLASGAKMIGVDRGLVYGERREKMLDLLLGLALMAAEKKGMVPHGSK